MKTESLRLRTPSETKATGKHRRNAKVGNTGVGKVCAAGSGWRMGLGLGPRGMKHHKKTDGERVHEALHTLNTVDRLDTKDLHKVAEQIEKDNAKFPVKPAAAVPVPTEDPGTEGPGTEGNAPQGESSQKVEDQDGEEAKKAEKARIKKDQNARYNRFKRTLDSQNPR